MKLSDTLKKIKKDRGLTQQRQVGELLAAIPIDPSNPKSGLKPITQQRISKWMKGSDMFEELWAVFKKVVLEIDPMVLYDDLTEPEAVLRGVIEMYHRVPDEFKNEFWRKFREAAEQKYHNKSGSHSRHAPSTRRRRKKGVTARNASAVSTADDESED